MWSTVFKALVAMLQETEGLSKINLIHRYTLPHITKNFSYKEKELEHTPNWPAHAYQMCYHILFQRSICSVAIPGCYEPICEKKVS